VCEPIPWDTFRKEVLRLYQSPSRRPATRAKVRQVLKEFDPICPSTDKLDPAAISDWLAQHASRKSVTNRSLLSALRRAARYGAYKQWLNNPFDFQRLDGWFPADELTDVDDEFARHRSEAEIAAVLCQADAEAHAQTGEEGWAARRLRAAVWTWAYTGAGAREVLGLRIQDVDLQADIIAIRSHPKRRLKTGARAAELSIAPPLKPVLAGWVDECRSEWLFPGRMRVGPWLTGGPGYRPVDRVRQLGERAGVRGLTILAFRHSVGTHAERWGWGELELQRILRHSRRKTQLAYRHRDRQLMRQTVARIRWEHQTSSGGG
jgi:integrase